MLEVQKLLMPESKLMKNDISKWFSIGCRRLYLYVCGSMPV